MPFRPISTKCTPTELIAWEQEMTNSGYGAATFIASAFGHYWNAQSARHPATAVQATISAISSMCAARFIRRGSDDFAFGTALEASIDRFVASEIPALIRRLQYWSETHERFARAIQDAETRHDFTELQCEWLYRLWVGETMPTFTDEYLATTTEMQRKWEHPDRWPTE